MKWPNESLIIFMFQEYTAEFIIQVEINRYNFIPALDHMVIYKSETYEFADELVDANLITAEQGCIFISLNFVNQNILFKTEA